MKSSPRKNKKVYRIALYGHSGSGKTCILAALAMERLPHPDGLSCIWLTSGQEEGRKWLKDAINAFENQQVPNPNPPTSMHLSFDFSFSADGRNYPVEMIDYSGELVNPALSDHENAKLLTEHLKDMDALLVLAPAPRSGDPDPKLSDDLLAITRTFKSFCEKAGEHKTHLDKPVVMLVNMWDRMYGQKFSAPEFSMAATLPGNDSGVQSSKSLNMDSEQHRLQQLLDSDLLRSHRALHNALKNSLPERDFAIFPVSAIGFCEKVTTDGHQFERPKYLKPLHSFGLEDAFVWALRRRDELDIANLEDQTHELAAEKLSQWKPWPRLGLWQQGKALLKRFPRNSQLYQKTHPIVHQLRMSFWRRTGMTVVYLLSVALISEAVIDATRYRSVNAVFHDPKASVEQLQRAEKWLEDYHSSSFLWHRVYKAFKLSTKIAGAELDAFRLGREELFLQPLQQSTSVEQKFKAAQDYLQAFPNGKHRAEAVKAIQVYELHQQETDWREVESAGTLKDKAKRANDYLKKYPYNDHAVDARSIIAEESNTRSWGEFLRQYNALIGGSQLSEAAELLVTRNPETPELRALKADFPKQAMDKLSQKMQDITAKQQWEAGVKELDNASRWPSALTNEEVQQKIGKLRENLNENWDRGLYQSALKSKELSDLQAYLAQAPLKVMEKPVQEYLKYLADNKEPINLRLELVHVMWNDDVSEKSETRYTVSVNGKNVIDQPSGKNESGELMKINAIGSFAARLGDEVSLTTSVKGDGFFGDNVNLGYGYVKLPASALNGYSLEIKDTDGNTSKVLFALHGMPKMPKMPTEWVR